MTWVPHVEMAMVKRLLALWLLACVWLLVVIAPPSASAQDTVTVSGRVVHSVTAEPIPGAIVRIQQLGRGVRADGSGRYAFEGVAPGNYQLVVTAPGFVGRRVEIVVLEGLAASTDLAIDPELRYKEVVSVSPEPRTSLESYQPTSVLAGQDLAVQLGGTLSATLRTQPGLAERSLGPNPGRPVIRGLDGDRVLILEDGQRMGDLSSQSADHAVPLDPAVATRIEVVRGPATLLYGANAIGGLVNVISDRIPTTPVTSASGSVTISAESAASGAGGAADILVGNGHWALHAIGSGRRTGNTGTAEGVIENTQSRGGFGNVGLSWTSERGYVGGNYAYDDMAYGIPFIEGGDVRLTPQRHTIGLRSAVGGLPGPFESLRASFGLRRYRHQEGPADETGTRKAYDTTEFDMKLKQRRVGRLDGTLGGSMVDRRYVVSGEEALSPPVDERGFAAFVYEELRWPHAAIQAGARLDRARYRPEGGARERAFTNFSGSLGLLVRPAARADVVTLAFNLAQAARHPALEELYFFGPHHSIFAFDIGNEELETEHALGFDASLRWQLPRAAGELTYFRNSIQDYIFRNPISDEEFLARFGRIEPDEDGLPFVQFSAADSLFQGVEAHSAVTLATWLTADFGFDYVRGQFQATKEPLPRIPPKRLWVRLTHRTDTWQVGSELSVIGDQERVFREETPTRGATLLSGFGAYSFTAAHAVHLVTVKVHNATNRLYRNHLSFIKDVLPETGRSVVLTYRMRF